MLAESIDVPCVFARSVLNVVLRKPASDADREEAAARNAARREELSARYPLAPIGWRDVPEPSGSVPGLAPSARLRRAFSGGIRELDVRLRRRRGSTLAGAGGVGPPSGLPADASQYAPERPNEEEPRLMEPVRTRRSGRSSTGTTGSSRSTCSTRCCGAGRRAPSRCSTTSPAPPPAPGSSRRPISGAEFAAARRRAEETARLRSVEEFGTAEVTLAQITEQLGSLSAGTPTIRRCSPGWPPPKPAAEADALVADRGLVALVREQAEAGRRMVVVSDTYLGPGHLASLLSGAGYPDDAFERIFVSSSYGVSKSVGLFETRRR